MSSAALKQLSELHRTIYERALADANESIGNSSPVIARYAAEYSQSLPKLFKTSTARKLTQAIDSHRIVLFGDFHSHKQCQRALLRVIRSYNQTPDHAPICVALEMFRTSDQPILDQWQAGLITDEKLLEKTDYESIWGFPWANYRPILEYCRYHSIPLYAANTKSAGRDNLKTRDEHAAKLLSKLATTHRTAKIFYLVGEYHLADSHLPAALTKTATKSTLSVLRIILNADQYYFMLPPAKVHKRDEVLELTPHFYCILNSPPWIKWQSQVLAEEMRRIGNSTYIESEIIGDDLEDGPEYEEDDYEPFTEDVIDLDHHLKHTIESVGSFLKIKDPAKIQDTFKIVPNVENDDIEHLPLQARATIFEQASRDGLAVDYARRVLFLPEVSINNLAFASGLVIFGSLSKLRENYRSPEDLYIAQILKMTFGYIATKILNPRVSLHTRRAIEDYLGAISGKHVAGQTRLRREVARKSLKFLDWSINSIQSLDKKSQAKPVPLDILDVDRRSSHDVGRHVAQTVAATVYQRLLAGKIDANDLSRWFAKNCDTNDKAKRLLAEMLRLT